MNNLYHALKTFETATELALLDGSHLKLGALATVHAVLIAYIPLSKEDDLTNLAQHGRAFFRIIGTLLSCLMDTTKCDAQWSAGAGACDREGFLSSARSGPESRNRLLKTILIKLDELSCDVVRPDSVEVLWRAAEYVDIQHIEDQDQAVAILHLLDNCMDPLQSTGEAFSRCITLYPHAISFIVEGLSCSLPIREAALGLITHEGHNWFPLGTAYADELHGEWLNAGLAPTLLRLLITTAANANG